MILSTEPRTLNTHTVAHSTRIVVGALIFHNYSGFKLKGLVTDKN